MTQLENTPSPQASRAGRRRSARPTRRGITLLFVVSMIVLFLLMGTTFVVVANNFYQDSRNRARKHIHKLDHQALLENAVYELLRGTDLNNSASPLRGHSLLADMYGYGFSAEVQTATADSSGHFLQVTLDVSTAQRVIDGSSYSPQPIPGALAGLVLSVVGGPAQGLTTRIVDHQVSGTSANATHTLVLLPQWQDNQFDVTDAAALNGARVIVNGRPFAGTGAGHLSTAALSTSRLSGMALYPNQSGRSRDELLGATGPLGNGYYSAATSGSTLPNSMGPNEAYDALDFQNMYLAGLLADGTPVKPSFHRQELVDNVASSTVASADFRAFAAGGPGNDGVVVDNNRDGIPDGIWIDTGTPVQTSPNGQVFKPLISYTVLDLDSRVNLNAHGSLYADDRRMSEIGLLENPVELYRGAGMGPAEIQLAPVVGPLSGTLMNSRYGPDGLPGVGGQRDVWSGYQHFGLRDAGFGGLVPGTVGGHYSTAMDIHGRFAVGYPQITDIQDPTFPIGAPVANVGFSNLPSELQDSPYEFNFSNDAFFGPLTRGDDRPFTPRELEAVLRRMDPDSRLLPQRLVQLGGNLLQRTTTLSYEVPTSHENLNARLFRILNTANNGSGVVGIPNSTSNRDQAIRDQLKLMLAPELCRGLPMNVNRELGDGVDNNGNGVVDEIGESDQLGHPGGSSHPFDHDNDAFTSGDFDTVLARQNFARQLFVATLLVTERIDRNGDGDVTVAGDWYDFNDDGAITNQDWLDYRLAIAQWAINVVDFRDPDSIMSPFEVDLNPFDGWGVDGNPTTDDDGLATRRLLWGAERPEMLISETLVTHDRRSQNLNYEAANPGESPGRYPDDDQDFDSNLVPNVAAFFELYNPWVANDANQIRPAELYDNGLNGVDLQKTSPDGSSPVWRLVVTGVDQQEADPDGPPGNRPTLERRIYFKRPNPSVDIGPEVYYPEDNVAAGSLAPGRYAMVGSAGVQVGDRYDTYFGRRSTPTALNANELHNQTRRISLNPSAGEVEVVSAQRNGAVVDMQVSTRNMVALPIGLNDNGFARMLGVSDPLRGYYNLTDPIFGYNIDLEPIADGWKFMESATTGSPIDYAFDDPIDKRIDPTHYDQYLKDDGLVTGYRVVHLQRLANPTQPFNPTANPYLTIDSSALDLFVFNGAEILDDPLGNEGVMRFGTYERRATQNADTNESDANRHRLLFRHDRLGRVDAMEVTENDFTGEDSHILGWNLSESLGRLNQAYREAVPGEPQPFAWLTWNNRPFTSQLELANVPFLASSWLTRRFSSADRTRDRYAPDVEENALTGATSLSSQFPHLLNFYCDELDGETAGPQLHRLFNVTEVPSRFSGVEAYVNPVTFGDNDHGLSFGLAPPFDRVSNYRYPGKININTVFDQPTWNALMGPYASQLSFSDWVQSRAGDSAVTVTDFANPLRPGQSANLVPALPLAPNAMVLDPVDCGLFRRAAVGSSDALLDYEPDNTVLAFHEDRAAYFKYQMRQRMGNLVTNRSSAFAVWITVGYFEVNPDGSLKTDSMGQGIELGADRGEAQRGQGFFLIDRSIPVAFEPGKNHNVDRAILVKSILQ